MSLEFVSNEVTAVRTAQELQEAVLARAHNIVLQAHLDLSTIPPILIPSPTPLSSDTPSDVLLGILPLDVHSIRGNCTEPPTAAEAAAMGLKGAPLRGFKARQCLVVADQRVLDTSRGDATGDSTSVTGWHRLWLDGLYFRYKRSTRAPNGYNAGMVSATSFSEVFMTAVTMQGDGDGSLDCGACGVRAGGTGLYAEGCTFVDLEGDMVIHTAQRSTTSLKGCQFSGNRGHPLGVLNGHGAADGTGAVVRVESCTFTDNVGAHLLQIMKWQPGDRTVFYADRDMHVFHNGSHWNVPEIDDIVDERGSTAAPLEQYSGDRVTLGPENEYFLRLKRALPEIPRNHLAGLPMETVVEGNAAYDSFADSVAPSSARASRGLVAGLAAAGAVLLLVAAAAVALYVLLQRKRHRKPGRKESPDGGMVAQGNSTLLIAHPSSNLDAPQRPGTLQGSGTHHTSALLSSMQVASLADAPHLLGPPRRGALDLSHGPLPLPTSSEASHTTFSELHKLPHALEPSSEASRTSKAGRSSLILCSNTSGDPNATTTHTTADTTAGLRDTGTEHTTASISWLAGDRRHAWHEDMSPSAVASRAAPGMHAAVAATAGHVHGHGSGMHGHGSIIHTLDATQGQHLTAMQGLQGTVEETFDVTTVMTMPVPQQAGATLSRELLETALDNIFNCGGLFLQQFELLGPLHRRSGGQGVVQFARSAHSMEGVAIKFFLNPHAFQCEEALYMRPELRSMMPAITLIESNEAGVALTEKGWKFPPFIVVERGESLDEWQRRIQPDFPTIVQVLSHVAERVHTLHALGVAHRDLKPGNVLWRPLEHSWTLIDFGCAAEIGLTTRLTFSPAFAPPETLAAVHRGALTTVADIAADVWAMGVIAFELITKYPPFPVLEWKHEDILAAALGLRPYPWEAEVGVFRNVPELRILGAVVKGCLNRDAGQRPTAERVLTQLNSLFDSGA